MTKKKSIVGIVLVGIIALGVGLGLLSLDGTSDENTLDVPLEDQELVLVALDDKDNPHVLEDAEITITFLRGNEASSVEFRGSAGCNSYFGSFEAIPDGLAVGPIGATEMWCDGEDVMDQEFRFLKALGMVEEYHVSGDTLEMPYDGGVLIFTVR